MTEDHEYGFAVLPAPVGYQVITIDDDDGDPIIEHRISAPQPVIGFVIRRYGFDYFSVLPVTPVGVHDELPEYALIRPDGQVEISGMRGDRIFASIDDWK